MNALQQEQNSLCTGCPFLGAARDSDIRFSYASSGARCYRAESPQAIPLNHQSEFCLTNEHTACAVFQRRKTRLLSKPTRNRPRRSILMGAVALLCVVVLLAAINLRRLSPLDQVAEAQEAEPSAVVQSNTNRDSRANVAAPTKNAEAIVPTLIPTWTRMPDQRPPATATQTAQPTSTVEPSKTPLPTLTSTPEPTAIVIPVESMRATDMPQPTNTPLPTSTATPDGAFVLTDGAELTLRRGPHPDYFSVGTVDGSIEMIEIVGRSNSAEWLKLCCVNGQSGWIWSGAVETLGDVDSVPIEAAPAPRLVVNVPFLNVRSGPQPEYDSFAQIVRNEDFEIIGRNVGQDWLQFCCVNGSVGWVYGNSTRLDGPIGFVPIIRGIALIPTTAAPQEDSEPAIEQTATPATASPTQPAEQTPQPTPTP